MAYTWGANGLVSERFLTGTPYSLWYHFGPQGETRYLTNMPVPPNPAAIVDTYLYTAYGEPVASTGADRNPFQYGGQVGYYTGPGAGLVLCGARWYNPYTARWMTRDPIGYAGGEDLYAYCGESPVGGLDPGGLDCGGGGYWLGVESAPPPGGDGLSGWDLLPVIGSGRDIFYGIENGDPLRFGLGIVGMVVDVGSLGTDFLEKGAAEAAIKGGIRWMDLGAGPAWDEMRGALLRRGYALKDRLVRPSEERMVPTMESADEIHFNLRGASLEGLQDQRYVTSREWAAIVDRQHLIDKTTVYNGPQGLVIPGGMTTGHL